VYKTIIKPLLFSFAPEDAHYKALSLFRFSLKIPLLSHLLRSTLKSKNVPVTKVMGISFPNKVGLAAGFDKDGKYMDLMSQMGFGFLEIGTVTPLPQNGNPKPRLFRLPKDEALINRMGFNNEGLEAFAQRLKNNRPKNMIIGANIGKNKVTPNEDAINDYVKCFEKLQPLADYFVVNVSSPNTPGLRELQNKGPLLEILDRLQKINMKAEQQKPILLKIAPDITEEQLIDIGEIIGISGIEGVIATNTTIDRSSLVSDSNKVAEIGNGGLSGAPLQIRSTEVISRLRNLLGPDKTIIGVGGINSTSSAQEKLDAGADLVQLYSGLIYEGPWLVKRVAEGVR